MFYRQCSQCHDYFPSTQIEKFIDNGEKKNICQFCAEGVLPADRNNSTYKLMFRYNAITRVPIGRLMNV